MTNDIPHTKSKKKPTPKLRFNSFNDKWTELTLESVTEKIQDGTHFSPVQQEKGNYKYITSKNIRNGFMDLSDISFLDDEAHREIYKRCDVKFNDVLLTKDGASTGAVCLNELKEEFSLLSSVAFLRANNKLATNNFIYQVLAGPKGQSEIQASIAGQAITRITLSKIRNYRFYFPSLPEQQKIASFLSAVDEEIQLLTRKKKLLEQYKKGVMQQLFSGKLRFKEENGKLYPKWEKKKLDEVCEINPSTGELPQSFIYVDLESVVKGQLIQEKRIHKEDAPSRAQRKLQPQDILYQTVRPYQMNNYLFDKEGDYVASTGYAQIRASQNTQYIFQILHSETFVGEVLERCTGTSFPAINSKDLGKIKVPIPHKEEQQKIANFLSALDAKIESMAAQIAHTQTFKKGLLQQMFV